LLELGLVVKKKMVNLKLARSFKGAIVKKRWKITTKKIWKRSVQVKTKVTIGGPKDKNMQHKKKFHMFNIMLW
jgi:hypothetical protein